MRETHGGTLQLDLRTAYGCSWRHGNFQAVQGQCIIWEPDKLRVYRKLEDIGRWYTRREYTTIKPEQFESRDERQRAWNGKMASWRIINKPSNWASFLRRQERYERLLRFPLDHEVLTALRCALAVGDIKINLRGQRASTIEIDAQYVAHAPSTPNQRIPSSVGGLVGFYCSSWMLPVKNRRPSENMQYRGKRELTSSSFCARWTFARATSCVCSAFWRFLSVEYSFFSVLLRIFSALTAFCKKRDQYPVYIQTNHCWPCAPWIQTSQYARGR